MNLHIYFSMSYFTCLNAPFIDFSEIFADAPLHVFHLKGVVSQENVQTFFLFDNLLKGVDRL